MKVLSPIFTALLLVLVSTTPGMAGPEELIPNTEINQECKIPKQPWTSGPLEQTYFIDDMLCVGIKVNQIMIFQEELDELTIGYVGLVNAEHVLGMNGTTAGFGQYSTCDLWTSQGNWCDNSGMPSQPVRVADGSVTQEGQICDVDVTVYVYPWQGAPGETTAPQRMLLPCETISIGD